METNPQPHRQLREDAQYAGRLLADFAAHVWDATADELMPWVAQALYALAYLDMLRARIAIRRSRTTDRA